jgi:CspA family cold shock protein
MGKPLGMGAIAITSKLYLSDRQARYAHLFQGLGWAAATASAEGEQYLKAFEIFVLKENAVAPDKEHLAQVERIRMLLTMLEWREGDPAWLEATRYMEIERLPDNLNEYKERPVLPDPLVVAGGAAAAVRPVHRVDRTPPSAQRQPSGLLAANQRGKVKWFNEAKGYGFIVAEDGTEVFVHRTGIAVLEGAPLRQGQRVTYDLVKGIKGPQARNVRLAP